MSTNKVYVRRSSSIERSRLSHLFADKTVYEKRLFLHYADLEDTTTIRRIVAKIRPHEFYHLAFRHVGLDWKDFVVHDARYERPHDVAHVLGNPDKARRELGWQPRRSFSDLVTDMVNADLELL